MDKGTVEDLHDVTQSVSDLSSAFGVSQSVMKGRLEVLGLKN